MSSYSSVLNTIINSEIFDVDTTSKVENLNVSGDCNIALDLYVEGSLHIAGDTIINNVEELSISDNKLILNSDVTTGTPSENASIEVKRGSQQNALLKWDESVDLFKMGTTSDNHVVARYADAINSARLLYYDSSDKLIKSSSGVVNVAEDSYTFPFINNTQITTIGVNTDIIDSAGDLTIGSTSANMIICRNMYVDAHDAYSLGSNATRWLNSYVTNNYSSNTFCNELAPVATSNTMRIGYNASAVNICANLLPNVNNSVALGSSSYKYSNVYATNSTIDNLYSNELAPKANGDSIRLGYQATAINVASLLQPTTDNGSALGATLKRFSNVYSVLSNFGTSYIGDLKISNNVLENTTVNPILIKQNLLPYTDYGYNLGSPTYRWGTLYSNGLIGGVSSGVDLVLTSYSTRIDIQGSLIPHTDGDFDIGTSSKRYYNSYVQNSYATAGFIGGIQMVGNLITATTSNTNVSIAGSGTGVLVTGSNIEPSVSGKSIGSSSKKYGDAYVGGLQLASGTISTTTTNGDLQITANGSGVIKYYSNGRYKTLGYIPTLWGFYDVLPNTYFSSNATMNTYGANEGGHVRQVDANGNYILFTTGTTNTEGVYMFEARLGRANDRCVCDILVNNVYKTTVDLYCNDAGDIPASRVCVYHDLTTTDYLSIKFLTAGKNASSSGYYLLLADCITIYKISD